MSAGSHRSLSSGPAFRRQLSSAIEHLIVVFAPKRMVLFGSWRTGTARPESSVDILIIAQTELRFMERIKLAIRTTEDDLPMIAPLVYTPQELKLLQHQGDGFIQSILAEGEILFEDGVGN